MRSMKKICKPLFILMFGMSATAAVQGALVFEASWVDILSTARASDGSSRDTKSSSGLAGLEVGIQGAVSAQVFTSSSSAFSSANATFDGLSEFTANLNVNLSTSGRLSSAIARSYFFVDFRIEGQPENSPIFDFDSSFSSTDPDFEGYPSNRSPLFSIKDQNGITMGGMLQPGSYRASVSLDLADSWPYNGTTVWTMTGSLLFDSAVTAPGFDQNNPIMPGLSNPGQFAFENIMSGRWFDPPATEGYTFQTTDGSKFTNILNFPSGFNTDFSVVVGGQVLGTFGAGDSVNFESFLGGAVSQFQILGISPTVDSEDPLAFPIQLAFSTPTASFTMSAIVPEPSTGLFAAMGAAALCLRRARRM